MKIKLIFIKITALLVLQCATNKEQSPNILLFMVDDMGYSDLGCYGGEIKTPNLDKLASEGLRFTQFNNCARCWPTRAALLSGYYPQQVGRDNAPGIKGGGRGIRPDWASLIPVYLKEAGYQSYHSGKWHIDGMPVESGFEHSYYLADQGRFFSPQKHYADDNQQSPIERGSGYYATVEIADRAIEHLKDHKVNHVNKPFFSYVAFTAPHFPLHALPEDIEAVGERYKAGWGKHRKERWERIKKLGIIQGELSQVEREQGPPYHFPKAFELLGDGEVRFPVEWESLTLEQKKFQQAKMTIHAAMIERVDKEIGRIIVQLKEMDVFDNTIIMFLSDNGASAEIMVRDDGHDPGAEAGSADTYLCLGPGWSTMCNTPFRKHKTWVHEGGSCTPFILHWPDGIEARGELRHTHGHVTDIVPTILDLVGITAKDLSEIDFPGQSLKPLFEKDSSRKHPTWYYHEGNRAIRVGDWKLVAAKEEPWELYNLKEDRAETNNLADSNQSKVLEMEKQWNRMLSEIREVTTVKGNGEKNVSVTTKNLK